MAERLDATARIPLPVTEQPELPFLLRVRIVLQYLVLWLESFTFLLWKPACFIAVFFALAIADILPGLGRILHNLVLGGFIVGTVATFWRSWAAFKAPKMADARNRLDTNRDIPHRPLQSFMDKPGHRFDAHQQAIWKEHKAQTGQKLARLRVQSPAPVFVRYDPYAVRFAVIVAVVLALPLIGADWKERINAALSPGVPFGFAAQTTTVRLWVSPPAYTGQPGFYRELTSGQKSKVSPEPVDIYANSTATILVTGNNVTTPPVLTYGKTNTTLEKQARNSFRIETQLPGQLETAENPANSTQGENPSTRLQVTANSTKLVDIPVRHILDKPPVILFNGEPQETTRNLLRIGFLAGDDFSIEKANLVFQKTNSLSGARHVYPLSLVPDKKTGENKRLFGNDSALYAFADTLDLTAHPLSGLTVDLTLEATDKAMQTGQSKPLRITLPEREFTHPVARALAKERRHLSEYPETAGQTVQLLADIAKKPGKFGHDTVVFLGLATARARLDYKRTLADIDSVIGLLWKLALRIEDGELPQAEQDLSQAAKALRQALQNKAPTAEIRHKLQQLRKAMENYLQAFFKKMAAAGKSDELTYIITKDAFNPAEIARLFNNIDEMLSMGGQKQAAQLLSKLDKMIDSLRNAEIRSISEDELKKTMEMANALGELIRQQASLLDQVFMRKDYTGPGQQKTNATDAMLQKAIADDLDQLSKQIAKQAGQMPAHLTDAHKAMQGAIENLQNNDIDGAVKAQGEALSRLRKGLSSSMSAMIHKLMGTSMPDMFGDKGTRSDPFGRATNPDDMELPDKDARNKVHDILDELRKRAASSKRPVDEKAYIRRLLEQF